MVIWASGQEESQESEEEKSEEKSEEYEESEERMLGGKEVKRLLLLALGIHGRPGMFPAQHLSKMQLPPFNTTATFNSAVGTFFPVEHGTFRVARLFTAPTPTTAAGHTAPTGYFLVLPCLQFTSQVIFQSPGARLPLIVNIIKPLCNGPKTWLDLFEMMFNLP